MNLEINAGVNSIHLIGSGTHANEMKFKGVLVNLDVPSTKPPNGSQGKRIMIPTATAKAALSTLKNMGLNYTDKLDGHNPRKKVGVIKRAWIEGNAIHVEGIIWKRDFPEAEKDLKQKNLGMSFEATNIAVEDQNAPVWKITSMCFTGASILFKKDAAYFATEALAAAKLRNAASQITKIQGGISMATKQKEHTAKKSSKKVSASGDSGEQLGPVLVSLTASFKDMSKAMAAMTQSNEALRSELHLVAAGVTTDESESEEIEAAAESEEASAESESIAAGGFPMPQKKKKKEVIVESADPSESESTEESMSADADDEGSLTKMESSDGPDEEDKPGSLNKDAKQKGSQTKVEDKVGKQVNDAILGSSTTRKLLRAVKQLQAQSAEDRSTIKKLKKAVKESKVQLQAASDRTERRTMSATGRALLIKGGIDPDALHASNRKLTVDEVDAMISASGIQMSTVDKIALKGEFARNGAMEEGVVTRAQVN